MDLATAHTLALDVLSRASSQDPEILKPAEAKLKEWETESGFYSVLYVSITLIFKKNTLVNCSVIDFNFMRLKILALSVEKSS